ncbi:flagellar basal-body rod protein FlgF [Pseudomonas sp. BGr12]|uniref:Flagellar basal-body rod protein FlgF n=1 Tax=Pseudomonas denitrificans TaxID=43306 RepID=A0A9X7R4S0_PSEDE|nr:MULTISPECIES: flagellar basal-body rod protein FlgF [Pseudomonadaceae]OQR31179.1 flagellar basal-body rod protein FlgF [Pseudomonas sp. T]KJK00481.1 flagellar basal body rod protein FlgF [Pseudomonas sp. 21]MBD9500020.1 flagellar basal-body rod protein FlgF [Pseudomonas sp. PDM17]MBD9512501.1 flagellar basal-body rod protein FlgF [Pseudomonas sp. PDM22]MBD9575286.1 flagellar basal-body rod protein FlgF [Pseudomonas sp. PDM23]
MDRMLYVAMSGASQNTKAMQAHANNLANISTTGFRRDFEQARAMPVFGDSFPARVFAMSERPATDFTTGSLQETGRDLDVAAKGDAWIAVQAPDGGEAYVRTGSLEIDALGQLRTSDGMPVMGNGGPIAIPPEEKIDIGEDGTITIRGQGNNPNALATVDRIKLVTPDAKQLEKGSDGLIRMKSGQPAPQVDANASVQSGVLEASNVNAVDEMTSILALSRQFELHVKMMKTAEEDSQSMARVLQFS